MGAYVTAVWGWDEEVQRGFHSRSFDPGRWQIVTADGADVGMLAVDHRPTEIYLGRIELLPAHQGRGIGTELITVLLDQAAAGQGSDPDVLTVNHRALALYRRLGLREVARHGDGDIKIRMRSTPHRPSDS